LSRYIGPKLGELQERILNHFFQCESKRIEGINHISKAINAKESSVSRSIDILLYNKFLQEDPKRAREKGNKFFEKAIYLTDKGAAYAVVMLGVKLEQIKNYISKYDSTSATGWDQYFEAFQIPANREYIFRKTMEFLLTNNIFDDKGRMRQLTEDEIQKKAIFEFTAAREHIESVDSSGITNFNDFLHECGIDKNDMKKYLLYKKRETDWALNELTNDNPFTGPSGF
jgi:DNA-binding MarR family transcriptional regulator